MRNTKNAIWAHVGAAVLAAIAAQVAVRYLEKRGFFDA